MMLPSLPPGSTGEHPANAQGPVLTVVARTDPGTGIDELTLTQGRWAQSPDEVVMAAGSDFRILLGETVTMGQGADASEVTVVGLARSVSDTADAWMTPGGLAALHAPSTGYQMLYRLSDAGNASRVGEARDAVTAALPAGAVTSATSWLTVKTGSQRPDVAVRPLPVDLRRAEPPAVRADRRHGHRRRRRLDDPPDRHLEGARVHAVPGRASVRGTGPDSRDGRRRAWRHRRQPDRGAAAGRDREPLRHGRPDDRSLGGRRRAGRCARRGDGHRVSRRGTRGAALSRSRHSRSDVRRPRAVGSTRRGSPRGCHCRGP